MPSSRTSSHYVPPLAAADSVLFSGPKAPFQNLKLKIGCTITSKTFYWRTNVLVSIC